MKTCISVQKPYHLVVPTIAQIEESIQTLSPGEFFALFGWMTERHLEILRSDEFEAPELEAELLKALDSPRRVVEAKLFEDIRAEAAEAAP